MAVDDVLNEAGSEWTSPSGENKLRRALLRISEVSDSPSGLLGVYVNSSGPVYIPRELIPSEHHSSIKEGARLIVTGNVTTKYVRDLYFTKVESAPEPRPDDGLA